MSKFFPDGDDVSDFAWFTSRIAALVGGTMAVTFAGHAVYYAAPAVFFVLLFLALPLIIALPFVLMGDEVD